MQTQEERRVYNKNYAKQHLKKFNHFNCSLPNEDFYALERKLYSKNISKHDFLMYAIKHIDEKEEPIKQKAVEIKKEPITTNKFEIMQDMTVDEIESCGKSLICAIWKQSISDYRLAKKIQAKPEPTAKDKFDENKLGRIRRERKNAKKLEKECDTFFDDGYGQELLDMMGVHTSVKSIIEEIRSEYE